VLGTRNPIRRNHSQVERQHTVKSNTLTAVREAIKEARESGFRCAVSDVEGVWKDALRTDSPMDFLRKEFERSTLARMKTRAARVARETRACSPKARKAWVGALASTYVRTVRTCIQDCSREWELSLSLGR
jgi:hypothetical protein